MGHLWWVVLRFRPLNFLHTTVGRIIHSSTLSINQYMYGATAKLNGILVSIAADKAISLSSLHPVKSRDRGN